MKIHVLQHVEFEGPGMIADWARARGHTLATCKLYEGDVLPLVDAIDMLVIMGGSMGVYDESQYPWLAVEKQHIASAIHAGKPVLGICLGAQLIAASLGAKVAPHTHKEIGWFPIVVMDQAIGHPILSGLNHAMNVFHWHGDRFEIPSGAVHLMCSEACDNQAFFYADRVLGLQFHLEMDASAIDAIIRACGDELTPSLCIQSAEIIKQKAAIHQTRHTLFRLLDNWAVLHA